MPKTERFYYFTPTKYALAGVKDRRLKAAELDKTNDPYEFLPFRCDNEGEKDSFTRIKQSVSEDLKMICLSKTYKTPSLWGHYADNCRGIALGFDIEVHEDRRQSHINAIDYLEDKIEISEFGFQYIDGKLEYRSTEETRKMWHYKSHHWRHEEEWRVWESEENLQLKCVHFDTKNFSNSRSSSNLGHNRETNRCGSALTRSMKALQVSKRWRMEA